MPSATRLDPSNAFEKPCLVLAARQEELIQVIKGRLRAVRTNYLNMRAALPDRNYRNRSIRELRRQVGEGYYDYSSPDIDPEVSAAVGIMATSLANDGNGDGTERPSAIDLLKAAQLCARKLDPARRPKDDILRFHAEAVMAIIIEATGQRVTASRTRNSVYGPHLSDGVSRSLVEIFRQIDPSVTETTLANIVIEARRKYAGKPMHFRDFFPLATAPRIIPH